MVTRSASTGGSHQAERASVDFSGDIAASVRPTDAQRRYLARGLKEPGGKLPLFDPEGREIPRRTIETCIARGWAQPWVNNPIKPDWLVCRLTPAGYRVLGAEPPPEPRRSEERS